MPSPRVVETRADSWPQRMKRVLDVVVAAVLLLVTLPFCAAAAALILITMGRPILFRQQRIGLGGRPFTLLKFRTMRDLRDESQGLLSDRERLTRLGRLLRSTTIDEFPELVNVLKGEMSIVGPRPLLVAYRDLYTEEQWRRHCVRPGMAGPVLASGRNALSWSEKFRLDVGYVDNWSLGLDARILIRTAIGVLRREGIVADGHATMPRFDESEPSRGVGR